MVYYFLRGAYIDILCHFSLFNGCKVAKPRFLDLVDDDNV